MSTSEIVVLVLVLVLLLVAAVAAALVAQSRKRTRLQRTFGPEYDRTVQSSDRRRDAERELAEREQRRRSLDIRPLPAEDRRTFSERWRATQADFVDQPEQAVRQADILVAEVMGRRGYPVGDFEQMSRDVSVDHAQVVHEYREAHEISELNDRKQATTEQLRQAMVHYRALFTDLLSDTDDEYRGSHAAPDDRHDDAAAQAPAYPAGTGDRVQDDRTQGDRIQGDRIQGDRVPDDRMQDDRVQDDRTHGDRVPGDRTQDVGDTATEDSVHVRSADDHRTADERVSSDRAATSGADGGHGEPVGRHHRDVDEQDRPRA